MQLSSLARIAFSVFYFNICRRLFQTVEFLEIKRFQHVQGAPDQLWFLVCRSGDKVAADAAS